MKTKITIIGYGKMGKGVEVELKDWVLIFI